MNPSEKQSFDPGVANRRDFLRAASGAVAAATLSGVATPKVHVAENNTIRVALVGCGGRGSGAAVNALSTTGGPVRLVAMADVFARRLHGSLDYLQKECDRTGRDRPEG